MRPAASHGWRDVSARLCLFVFVYAYAYSYKTFLSKSMQHVLEQLLEQLTAKRQAARLDGEQPRIAAVRGQQRKNP